MFRPRRSASIRALALLLLLWVGFDVGAHGVLASDFTAIGGVGSAARLTAAPRGAETAASPEHCFCHGIYVSAIVPAVDEALMPAGGVVLAISPQPPRADGHPLDRPPQLNA